MQWGWSISRRATGWTLRDRKAEDVEKRKKKAGGDLGARMLGLFEQSTEVSTIE